MAEPQLMVLIGLGSNQGDSAGVVLQAMDDLAGYAAGALRRSDLWRTSPVDCPPDSGDFVNAAVAFGPRAGLTPEALLSGLKDLERAHGRTPSTVRNAPRALDLDLLLFGAEVRSDPQFVLPHPRAVNRRFVLEPAAEVLPDAIWPGTGRTIRELLANLESAEQVRRLPADAVQAGDARG